MKNYKKTAVQPMEEWDEWTEMEGVSVSDFDKQNGSPKQGDMIAFGDKGDKWLVAKRFFRENYEEVK